jgi:hypothetical protein
MLRSTALDDPRRTALRRQLGAKLRKIVDDVLFLVPESSEQSSVDVQGGVGPTPTQYFSGLGWSVPIP